MIELKNYGLKFNNKTFVPITAIQDNDETNQDINSTLKIKKIKITCFYVVQNKLFISSDNKTILKYNLDNGELLNTILLNEQVYLFKTNIARNLIYTLSKSNVTA